MLYKVNNLSNITVYNYADGTTIACTGVNYDTAHNKLLNASEILLDWIQSNYLKANPIKFQFIVFEESNVERRAQPCCTWCKQTIVFICQIVRCNRLTILFYSPNIFLNCV